MGEWRGGVVEEVEEGVDEEKEEEAIDQKLLAEVMLCCVPSLRLDRSDEDDD